MRKETQPATTEANNHGPSHTRGNMGTGINCPTSKLATRVDNNETNKSTAKTRPAFQ